MALPSFSAAKVLNRTIIGQLIALFESTPRAYTSDELVDLLSANVHDLRRADGGKYSGNVKRAVLGCLQQNQIFEYVDGKWVADLAAAQAYKERKVAAVTARRNKATHAPHTISQGRNNRLTSFLQQKVAEAETHPVWAKAFTPPFRRVPDHCSGEEIARKVGLERAIGLAQAFEIVKRQYQSIYEETSELSLARDMEKIVQEVVKTAAQIQQSARRIR